ncbi:MAG: adenosylcobalamin-dependent ribonucleoside-diphosphate reductase [Burkholderiaceae bacterium]
MPSETSPRRAAIAPAVDTLAPAAGHDPLAALTEQTVCRDVLLEKYAKNGETSIDQIRHRVARALAGPEQDPPRWAPVFYKTQSDGFIAGGRINSAAGTDLQATLINCFVQPVGDSVSEVRDGKPGIYVALQQAAETMRRGGGVGYDFSRIRPRGAFVSGTKSEASGPVSYMRVFDQSCNTVESAGARRGAQMGVLRIDHPDIRAFIDAKRDGSLANFNMSVGVTDAFMRALQTGAPWQLVHPSAPGEGFPEAVQRTDGQWVYDTVPATELWAQIMRSTYNHAEPGILFLDRINTDNNLWAIETIESTNPCGEQPLPDYGCCDLGSINLTGFVRAPFSDQAWFDTAAFETTATHAVRMLDNVLDVTVWPLPQQHQEAMDKRRIGLGFTGLGDALLMLGLAYDSPQARDQAGAIARTMRDAAYRASVDLAREKGPFPRFDADQYLGGRSFASRLPEDIKALIREHGIRNSHLLSIAPTGTISLAFADNASNGIEPAFSWWYTRRKREADNSIREYRVEDHAYRLYRALHGPDAALPPYFVTALELSADDHLAMVAAVAPFIDTAISKTVNVPEHYPFADFEQLYLHAWEQGLKGIATYRPNPVTGAVLVADSPATAAPAGSDTDRRLQVNVSMKPVMGSLRWPDRPILEQGAQGWVSEYIEHPTLGSFAVFVSHISDGRVSPFEVWVNGNEQPRALGALAKTLSVDMRSQDRAWLRRKLLSLMKLRGDDYFEMPMPPSGEMRQMPSLVAGFASLLKWRVEQLGAWEDDDQPTPLTDALMFKREPKTGTEGTLSWTVDVRNDATGDDFVLGLKELDMGSTGQGGLLRRPYSMWLAGDYPRVLDGVCKVLSIDMQVVDPAWIGLKLRKLTRFGEPLGDFMAAVPGSDKMRNWPSTVAYVAALILHRYRMLNILDEFGSPLNAMGVMQLAPTTHSESPVLRGKACPECANLTLIRKDGCEYCTACGHIGACG